jgi:hypothetical protein
VEIQMKVNISPILVLGYNRPDYLENLLDYLRYLKIDKLYISIDGPKSENPEDILLVNQCREVANATKSWCDSKVLFMDVNMGCYLGVTKGIDWFFNFEQSGIILEDDLIFDNRALDFLSLGLDMYKSTNSVGTISAYNHFDYFTNSELDIYSLSVNFPSSWGWATWRDRWQMLEKEFDGYSKISYCLKMRKFGGIGNTLYWLKLRQRLIVRNLDSWAYRWLITQARYNLNTIVPSTSLITNIGFRSDATHTKNEKKLNGNVEFTKEYRESKLHWVSKYDHTYQKLLEKKVYGLYPFFSKVRRKLRFIFINGIE